jgi:hypothetical protein
MRQRIAAATAVVVAMAAFALPSWGDKLFSDAKLFLDEGEPGSGDPMVFAVGEIKGWVSRPQLQGVSGQGASSGLLQPQGRRRDDVHENRRWGRGTRSTTTPESYMILKGGGLHITQNPATTGGYAGIELGGTMENVLQFGFSIDYFHHRTRDVQVLQESETNGLPLRAEQTVSESVAHLVPVGLTMRVRLPIASSILTPFISGTLSYEMLFLENRGTPPATDPLFASLQSQETFTGFGWQAAAGLDIGLSPTFGLLAELGWHRSAPHKEIQLDGQTVDLKIELDGPFLRGGLRIFM